MDKKNEILVEWTSNGHRMNQRACKIEVVDGKIVVWTYFNPSSPAHDFDCITLDPEKVSDITVVSCDNVVTPGF